MMTPTKTHPAPGQLDRVRAAFGIAGRGPTLTTRADREAFLAAAVDAGKISHSTKPVWAAALHKNPEKTAAEIEALASPGDGNIAAPANAALASFGIHRRAV